MSTTELSITQIRAEWQRMRQLYSFYAALNERFGLGVAPFSELSSAEEGIPDVELLQSARDWMSGIDNRATAFNLRQLMHSSAPLPEDKLRILILRHLHQLEKTEQLREKLDFLLVQYFAQVFGANVHPEEVGFRDVAEGLAPILGAVTPQNFGWAYELEKLTAKLREYSSLKDLIDSQFLDHGRSLKRSIGPEYFQPSALVAVTKFNFALRAGFFRLMHADIHAITDTLDQLRAAGVQTVDVSRADLGIKEPLDAIQEICQEWRKRLRSDYQVGNLFRQLAVIREVCEQRVSAISTERKAGRVASAPAVEENPVEKKIAEERPIEKRPAAAAQPVAVAKPAAVSNTPPESRLGKEAPKPQRPATPVSVPVKPSEIRAVSTNGAAATPPLPAVKQAVPVTSQQPAAASAPCELSECLEKIAEQLRAQKGKPAPVVILGETKLPLAKWEIAAFARTGDDVAAGIQSAVAARSLLVIAVEQFKKNPAFNLQSAVTTAKAEATKLEQEVLQAKQNKNIEGAVNLAASGKQLGMLIAKAQQLMK
jgi:hypothetical protein